MCAHDSVCVCVCVCARACVHEHVQGYIPTMDSLGKWEVARQRKTFTFTLFMMWGWFYIVTVNSNYNHNSKFSYLNFNPVKNFLLLLLHIRTVGYNLGRIRSLVSPGIFRAAIKYTSLPTHCLNFPARVASPPRTQVDICSSQTYWVFVLHWISLVSENS